VEHHLVYLKQRAVGVQNQNVLRERIYQRPQLPILVAEFLLRALSVLNIGSCRIPPNDFSALVPEWVVAYEEPAILAIFPGSPLLVLKRDIAQKGFLPVFSKSLNVLGMENTRARIGGLHFLERQSGVLECHSICVNGSPVWIQDDDRLWNEIDDAPKLFFILT